MEKIIMTSGVKALSKKSKLGVLAVVLAVVLLASAICLGTLSGEYVNLRQMIVAEDGQCAVLPVTAELEVEKEGRYVFDGGWSTDKDGFITGLYVTASDGSEPFAMTADSCDFRSERIELPAGICTVTLEFLTNALQAEEFCRVHNLPEVSSISDYTFAKDGTWTVDYEVGITVNPVAPYALGLIFGGIIGCIIAAIVLFITRNGESAKCEFDERQEAIRGTGYKYGFVTLVSYMVLWMIFDLFEVELPFTRVIGSFIGIIIAFAVAITYWIINDAYFSLNDNKPRLMIAFSLISVANIIIGVINAIEGRCVENGKLTIGSLNIICSILLLYVFVVILIRQRLAAKED